MKSPVIDLQNVSKTFSSWDDRPSSLKTLLAQMSTGKVKLGKREQRQILNDVSFQIMPGEFVGIMGRNGAGKSTIMKMIAGIYKPNSGSLNVVGRVAPLLELGAGFAPELSGYDNIFLNASILGFSKRAVDQLLSQIIEFSELGDAIQMPVQKYSSGMLVRLGFSIATHLDASILLFDEILAVGDIGFQTKCLKRIDELHAAGKAIVLVTHSPEQVAKYCDRCIVINEHRVAFDGPAAEGAEVYSKLFQT